MAQKDGPEYKVLGMNYRPLSIGRKGAGGFVTLLIVLSAICVILGALSGVLGMPVVAAGAVLAIFARMAQASRQHAELMDELRGRDEDS